MRVFFFSLIYICTRSLLKIIVFTKQRLCKQTRDLETVIELGKKLSTYLITSSFSKFATVFQCSASLRTKIYDLNFASPVTVSAYEAHFSLLQLFVNLGVGGVCLKTMMSKPRTGNTRPRIQEITINGQQSLVNAMGLPGIGAREFCKELLMSGLLNCERPIGLSIGGESYDDYWQSFEAYQAELVGLEYYPFYYEINISCPNTDSGQDLSKNTALLEQLIDDMKKQTNKVISVKVSPDQSNEQLQEIATMLSRKQRMMINTGNTQFKTSKELGLAEQLLPRAGGGLSGPSLFKRTLEMIELLAPYKVPLIATGGVNSASRVKQALDKGASLVGMATALALNPYVIVKINKQLVETHCYTSPCH
jgi:dihydroorotate dehydrogenase